MANNFLRYKYYLITRASAEELYTAVKDIFASVNIEQKTRIDNAIKAIDFIDVKTSSSLIALLADMVSSCTKIMGENKLCGEISVLDVGNICVYFAHKGGTSAETIILEPQNIGLTVFDNIIAMANVDIISAKNIAIRESSTCHIDVKARVLPRVYYPIIETEIKSNIISHVKNSGSMSARVVLYLSENSCVFGKTNETIKPSDIILTEDHIEIKTDLTDSLLAKISCLGHSLVLGKSKLSQSISNKQEIGIKTTICKKANLLGATNLKLVNFANFTTIQSKPVLFRKTTLADIADSLLKSIDGLKINVIDWTEII